MSLCSPVTRSATRSLALGAALVLGNLPPAPCAAATPEHKCRQQLKLLAEALGNYREDHNGAFPARLGDVLPRYISDQGLLRCPAALEQGAAGPADSGIIDPGVQDGRVVGYTWEMTAEEPQYWEGRQVGMSFGQFKELQRQSLIGKQVPVIRCSHHGPDYWLNLTENGSIYESGLYWECNFVDQIPVLRLYPRLVKQADKPMSELIRPRPGWATEGMLDLRPWCNARFEDPWVNCDVKMEELQRDRELSRGVLTNQDVAFDAAGIIQLNGKLRPGDKWQAFDYLAYPKVMKAIAVKRAFRVMHVLGAVQFEDSPGTSVATIELHRTGSLPEKWGWRYGVDVMNYRHLPGDAGPTLPSSAVAWNGNFAHPEAQMRKPRLFHLRFETADPETPVDHLDFVAGDGFSSPFIVAITIE